MKGRCCKGQTPFYIYTLKDDHHLHKGDNFIFFLCKRDQMSDGLGFKLNQKKS